VKREDLRQLSRWLRPLRQRVANMVARGVVQLVNDGKKQQLVQVGALEGEDIEGAGEGAEHFHPYGLSSIPKDGAECVVVFPNGDRGHPLVVAVSDRRYRPTGGQAGEVCMYTDEGDVIRLGRGHIVSVETEGEVRLGSAAASGDVVVQSALDYFLVKLAAAIAITSVADGKNALSNLLNALNALPGWKAGTTKTKAE
jgi:phage baseplate assembly protein V